MLAESTEGELPLAEGETSRARLHVRLGLEAPVSHESSLKSTAFRRRVGPSTRGSAVLSAIKLEDQLPSMHELRALESWNLLTPPYRVEADSTRWRRWVLARHSWRV